MMPQLPPDSSVIVKFLGVECQFPNSQPHSSYPNLLSVSLFFKYNHKIDVWKGPEKSLSTPVLPVGRTCFLHRLQAINF